MARPQSADYDLRKKIILEKASHIFAEHGYHKASVGDIAKECKISKSLMYHYFPSKQDILYHAMLDHVQELSKLAQSVMEKDQPAEKSLKEIIRNYLNIYEHTVPQHHLLINELGGLSPEQKKVIVGLQNNVVQAFADLAEKLSPAPLDAHKAKTAISMLMLGMINWTYIWFKPEGSINSDQLSEIISRIFIEGLKNLTTDIFEEN